MMDVFYTLAVPDFTKENENDLFLCNYHGIKMHVAAKGGGNYEIRQIISTEPKCFNRTDIAPGRIIKM